MMKREEEVDGLILTCMQLVRERASEIKNGEKLIFSEEEAKNSFVHIASHNNFPTAAGLASSAAGFSCLAFSLATLFGLNESFPGEISSIARVGSGSACRSLYGGFVKWQRGEKQDGSDSLAVQVIDEKHWPEMQVLVLVVSAQKKGVSSTVGMKRTVETSELFAERVKLVEEKRIPEMEKALKERDFDSFAKLTMQDSNQFHAVCLDTYPPIFYLNDVSARIIQLVTLFNESHGRPKAAYTFDAGPNAVVYLLKQDVPLFLQLVLHFFPPAVEQKKDSYFNNVDLLNEMGVEDLSQVPFPPSLLPKPFSSLGKSPGALQFIQHTSVGAGPQILPLSETQLDTTSGDLNKMK